MPPKPNFSSTAAPDGYEFVLNAKRGHTFGPSGYPLIKEVGTDGPAVEMTVDQLRAGGYTGALPTGGESSSTTGENSVVVPRKLAEILSAANGMSEQDLIENIGDLVKEAELIYEYVGFKPEVIMKKTADVFKKRLNEVLTLVAGTVCLRGTNLDKILKKSSQELIDAWKDHRGEFKHNPSGKYGNEDLTISRVAASFPRQMAAVAHKVCRSIVPQLVMAPKILVSTVYAPIAVKEGEEDAHKLARKINLIFLIEFDKIIKSRKGKHDAEEVKRYFKIAQNNELVKDDERKRLFIKFKIAEDIEIAMRDTAFKTFVDFYPVSL